MEHGFSSIIPGTSRVTEVLQWQKTPFQDDKHILFVVLNGVRGVKDLCSVAGGIGFGGGTDSPSNSCAESRIIETSFVTTGQAFSGKAPLQRDKLAVIKISRDG